MHFVFSLLHLVIASSGRIYQCRQTLAVILQTQENSRTCTCAQHRNKYSNQHWRHSWVTGRGEAAREERNAVLLVPGPPRVLRDVQKFYCKDFSIPKSSNNTNVGDLCIDIGAYFLPVFLQPLHSNHPRSWKWSETVEDVQAKISAAWLNQGFGGGACQAAAGQPAAAEPGPSFAVMAKTVPLVLWALCKVFSCTLWFKVTVLDDPLHKNPLTFLLWIWHTYC